MALATGISNTLKTSQFAFLLLFMKEFLNLISPADKILQSRDVGFREAMPVIQEVVSNIRNLRKELTFKRIYDASVELLNKINGAVPPQTRPKRDKTRSSTLNGFILTDKIGERNSDMTVEIKSAFYSVIDIFLSKMKRRFDDNIDILMAIADSPEFSLEKLMPLKKLGIELPSKEELLVAKSFIERKKKSHNDQLQQNNDTTYKNRFNLLKELYLVREAFRNDRHIPMWNCDLRVFFLCFRKSWGKETHHHG